VELLTAGRSRPVVTLRNVRWAGAMGALSLVMVGCGSSSQPTTDSPSRALLRSASAVIFAAPDGSDAKTLALARERVLARCMTARGFAYEAAPLLPIAPSGDRLPAADGYGLYVRFANAGPRARALLRSKLRGGSRLHFARRYLRALEGTSRQKASIPLPGGSAITYLTGGCQAQAISRIYGNLAEYHRSVAELNSIRLAVGTRIAADKALRRAVSHWRRCMSERGFRYPNADAARAAVYQDYVRARSVASVRTREAVVAAADRACGERSAVYNAVSRARQNTVRDVPIRVLRQAGELARARTAAVRRARAILAGSNQGSTASP
jgi:hypothetical protein